MKAKIKFDEKNLKGNDPSKISLFGKSFELIKNVDEGFSIRRYDFYLRLNFKELIK